MEDDGTGTKTRLAEERMRRLKLIKESLVKAKMKPDAIKDCFDPEEYKDLVAYEEHFRL